MRRRAALVAMFAAPGTAAAMWWDRFSLFQVRTPGGTIVIGLTREALDALGPGTVSERLDRALESEGGLVAWDYGPWPATGRRYVPGERVVLRRAGVLGIGHYVPARPVDPPPG